MTQASHSFVHPGLPAPTRTPLLTGDDPDHKRRELLAYFCQTFDLYDSLFDCLADERAWFNKAIPLRHPLIFYYGHTAAFFINKLLAAFNALIERGHTIVIVEHNMDVIKCADWVVDLGPEAGTGGGRVVFEGTPRNLEQCPASYTGKYLRLRTKL